MKQLATAVLLVCLGGAGISAQLAYYTDERGRRVYVNATPKPAPVDKLATGRSLLVGKKSSLARAAFVSVPVAAPIPAGAPVNVESVIREAAARHEVDVNLVRAIVRTESAFNSRAVSPKGAMGLMQLVPGTARRFGVENVFNPAENVEGGVRYLKYLLGLYRGDLTLSLAAYNAGEKAVERHGGVPPYRETRDYVKKIGGLYGSLLRQPAPNKSLGIVSYRDESGKLLFTNAP